MMLSGKHWERMMFWVEVHGVTRDGEVRAYKVGNPFSTIEAAAAEGRRLFDRESTGSIEIMKGYRVYDLSKAVVSEGTF
jgi:hypothetical protein